MKKCLVLIFVVVSFLLSPLANAQTAFGGKSGFDKDLEAIEPGPQNLSLSMAGEYPADISRYILASNQGAGSVRISPDGKTLAFLWSITGKRQIWTIPVHFVAAKAGRKMPTPAISQPKQMTFGNGVFSYSWSPDGKWIFYSADNNGDEQQAYYQISADGSAEEELLPSANGGFRRFGTFVDNQTIAFTSTERNGLDFDVYIADLKSKESKRVYEGKYGFFVNSASPDGRYLSVYESVGEDSDNLYLFDLEKQKMLSISQPERRANHHNAGAAWSPDSKGFYLASNQDRDYSALMYYSLEKGFSTVHQGQGDIEKVLLCGKQANYLIWSENDGGYSRLKGKDLVTGEAFSAPEFVQGVYFLDCSQRSDIVSITVNGYQTPGDIFTLNLKSGAIAHNFKANLAGLSADKMVRPESVSMPARDGVTVYGLLYLPVKKLPEQELINYEKPPVLFRVHGGPTAQSRPYFRATTQYLLGKGIAVLLPNVRGSTGYGHNYVTLDDRENRLDSIRDLVDMLAWLKQDGRVDTSRAAVAGGSYGGYAVNAVLANYPGHFVAGASLYGVADWVTALKVASPALKASDRLEYGDINEKYWLDFYTQQSPIRQADNINVPVLYSHGAQDPRIDIYETEVMVKTLRKNGIEAPYIRIMDEGHGWRKLENQLFYYRKEAEFLEEKLGIKKAGQ